jgi:glutamine synthetase
MTTAGTTAGADEIVHLCWTDYVGLVRCRAVPAAQFAVRRERGLGWAVAGQALTPFEAIADNPWGPMLEVRQTPVAGTAVRLDLWPGVPAFHIVLCDSNTNDGRHWDCCARGFFKDALARLEAATGLGFAAAFEHEFRLEGPGAPRATPFSLAAMREAAGFAGTLAQALTEAGVEPETVEPEYGRGQYEVSTTPAEGMAAADRAVITREVIREVARRAGLAASFTPKPSPDAVGAGAHVHFSFVDAAGGNAAYDPDAPAGAAPVTAAFAAGVLRHLPGLCALLAPSPVSYLRLRPHRWACGFASFGVQNREAALRICPSPHADPVRARAGYNIELRVPDGTANPYIALGAMIRAGLEGIAAGLPLPPVVDRDPADLDEAGRAALGIRPLPASLAEALALMQADPVVSGFLPPVMRDSWLSVKRKEISMTEGLSDADICARYLAAY